MRPSFYLTKYRMSLSNESVRVRFAPSPTGYLHVGGLRTALYNYLFARKHGGMFVLRIEDTDRARFVEGAVESLVDVLGKIGLAHDEGPYVQSKRLDLYKKHAEELIESGMAYRCFCAAERLEEMRKGQAERKLMPKYDRKCLTLSVEEVQAKLDAGEPHVVRMKVPDDREIAFDDLVRGRVSFRTETIDDTVLLKSDGYPTYHLANVVDDHLMNITHVIRAEEWLPSTPKHLLLYEAFGWEAPAFAHLPLLLNPDRSKLSKRQGDVAVEDYLVKGYLPEALVNFIALLGWNPGEGSTQEIFSLDELVERFDLSQVNKAGAVFDLRKLDWMNAEYIKALTIPELLERVNPFLETKEFFKIWSDEHEAWSKEEKELFLKRVIAIEQERLAKLSDIGEENPFFFRKPEIDPAMLPWKDNAPETAKESLGRANTVLEAVPEGEWTRERLGEVLLEAAGDRRGDFLWPLRVALSGEKKSPPPQDIAWVVGSEESLVRIENAIGILG